MITYLLIEHVDYECHTAVLHSNHKHKLIKMANKLNDLIKEYNCSEFNGMDFIRIEEDMQKILKSANLYIDKYLVEEIETI